MTSKVALKRFLGEIPFTAETYWYLRQAGRSLNTSFSLRDLQSRLPDLKLQAEKASRNKPPGKRILIFSVLHYWISHAAVVGLALAGLGHRVTLAYLPYARWQESLSAFDIRRQNLYALHVLNLARPLVSPVSFYQQKSNQENLPNVLMEIAAQISLRDTQYTLQIENVSPDSELYRLRLERNLQAASAALAWLQQARPDVVIVPNGSILEFGSVYQVTRYLDIPVVTYEFGEQRQRIWLAQNDDVMRQPTGNLWMARGGRGLTPSQFDQIQILFASRRQGELWGNFARRWQGIPSSGGEVMRETLGLDSRPVVLLATNVIGDSLTLGRQVFSASMTEWLERTTRFFAQNPNAQLVIRIHPGELVTKGPSVSEVVRNAIPNLPENIHLVEPDAEVNTYDLMEITSLGLVYTTTTGLEMVMEGVPVIVVGQTHYRNKGFTLDPGDWDSYFQMLDKAISNPQTFTLSRKQVERAWEYAYRFFFEYPQKFPWHLTRLWSDLDEWPLSRVLSDEGQAVFGDTFRYLAGELINWVDA